MSSSQMRDCDAYMVDAGQIVETKNTDGDEPHYSYRIDRASYVTRFGMIDVRNLSLAPFQNRVPDLKQLVDFLSATLVEGDPTPPVAE